MRKGAKRRSSCETARWMKWPRWRNLKWSSSRGFKIPKPFRRRLTWSLRRL